MIKKRSSLLEDKKLLHIYLPNNTVSKYMRQKIIGQRGEIDEATIIVYAFLSTIDRSSQKISKNIVELNSTINQLYLIDIYRLPHPTKQNTHSFQAHVEHSPR